MNMYRKPLFAIALMLWICIMMGRSAYADAASASLQVPQVASKAAAYEEGLHLMYDNEMQQSAEVFTALGDYRCSANYLKYCLSRLEENNQPFTYVLERSTSSCPYGAGTWYNLREAVIYLPDEINSETKWVLYFPGGNGGIRDDGIPMLFTYSIRDYLDAYSPSSIQVYWRSSGCYQLTPALDESYQVMESIAQNFGIAIRDLVVAGSSNGGYTAVKSSAYLLEQYGVPVSSVLVYDMGLSFTVAILPSEEEYRDIAKAGTKMFFFDQKDIGYNNSHILEMTNNGVDVQLIYCVKDEHSHITWDGFSLGTLSWATGELDSISPDAYVFAEKVE